MLIGIDVGGTTTDAVLIQNGEVYSTAKVSTEHGNLLNSLLEALDAVSKDVPPEQLERVVFSTTVITNLIAEGKTDRVALVLIPGPGVNPASYTFPDSFYLKGAMDYRGREIDPLDEAEVRRTVGLVRESGFSRAAIISKFGQRNPSHELRVEEIFREDYPDCKLELGHKVSGKLNFPRRIATAMLASATRERYQEFVEKIKKALEERNIRAPVYILKADGGTLPVEKSIEFPVETIFSGPAASTIGALALTPEGQTSVVVDIGGTTTDLALILSGKPLFASKGAKLGGFLTHVRAFAVRSIAAGGDSVVRVKDRNPGTKQITIGPDRAGPAYCMGGKETTPTDALKFLGLIEVGNPERASEAIKATASELGKSDTETASLIVDKVSRMIADAVNEMFFEWKQEPAYRVWEVLQEKKTRPENVVGIGGGAKGLIAEIAKKLNANPVIPEHAEVGNAIGAAVARPTITLNLHIDTEQKVYSVAEEGEIVSLNTTKFKNLNKISLDEAETLAAKLLNERAEDFGISEYADEAEIVNSEVFNVVNGWYTTGRLFDVNMQIPAGLIPEWKRREKA
ncbi:MULTISPECIES: hydantoinase/oxoprolinase family protein [Methanosarcina]|uniref:N-methylhydantoinase (ATP-hydrolyzing) n=3 Tax=Methanosarcina barkeri TaxID=2208 RepID=A0A0E3QVW1_METBA|nr:MULTISPECIES: hydantoinase/oxoprolinase family protein [Methanosarcina]AKB54799.1 N-methylhydantoinase (ATP-hydrolyzing) [Methanosarcina barkeri MS]AKB57120.1 N-methylhydantoinase (ATP-hydrolyzing) [Methanosarcina barkeri 227]OEC90489.1 hydantoinase [Methanosarcina sp. A14]